MQTKKKYVLAIDQSTQGTKAILFDEKAELVCRTDISHKQYISENGWISHDLNEIYSNTLLAVKNLIEKAGVPKESIVCIGISNQRETSAAWNRKTGEPLAKAIVWQCNRAENICERIRNKHVAEQIKEKTGLFLSPYFPASKYAWLQENVEKIRENRVQQKLCFGTIDSWLVFKLTNGKQFVTDYSNASRTQLFNINTLCWDEEICDWFDIDKECLPEVKDSSCFFGETDFEGIFDKPIPICGLIGDSQAALFGQGGINPGMVKATYGTGSSVMMNMGQKKIDSSQGLVTSLGWGINGEIVYVLEGNINYSGAVITWLKNDLKMISSPQETQQLAYQANLNDTTYLVPAFSGLGAPYWKPNARAVFSGMSRTTGKNEMVKAAVESIAYQITDIIHMMEKDYEAPIKRLFVDGGPIANQYLMQFQSDILNTMITLPRCEECSALGAGMMAGLQYGIYDEKILFSEQNRFHYECKMTEEERKGRYDGWKKAVEMVI